MAKYPVGSVVLNFLKRIPAPPGGPFELSQIKIYLFIQFMCAKISPEISILPHIPGNFLSFLYLNAYFWNYAPGFIELLREHFSLLFEIRWV